MRCFDLIWGGGIGTPYFFRAALTTGTMGPSRRTHHHLGRIRRWKAAVPCFLVLCWTAGTQGFTLPSRRSRGFAATHLYHHSRNKVRHDPHARRPSASSFLHARGGEGGEGATRRSKKVRLQVFSTLQLPIVEVCSTLAVLLSSLLVALNTLNDLPPVAYAAFDDALLAINLVFAVDFFVRWWCAGQFKTIYLTKPLVALDIVVVLVPLVLGSAIVPLLDYLGVNQGEAFTFLYGLQNSAGLQNLLLLRVLRLRRVLTDINTVSRPGAAFSGNTICTRKPTHRLFLNSLANSKWHSVSKQRIGGRTSCNWRASCCRFLHCLVSQRASFTPLNTTSTPKYRIISRLCSKWRCFLNDVC